MLNRRTSDHVMHLFGCHRSKLVGRELPSRSAFVLQLLAIRRTCRSASVVSGNRVATASATASAHTCRPVSSVEVGLRGQHRSRTATTFGPSVGRGHVVTVFTAADAAAAAAIVGTKRSRRCSKMCPFVNQCYSTDRTVGAPTYWEAGWVGKVLVKGVWLCWRWVCAVQIKVRLTVQSWTV